MSGAADIIDEDLLKRLAQGLPGDERALAAIAQQMMVASPAFFAQQVLTGPPDPPYNGRFLISEHHEEWDDLVATHNRLCILAPRDHGKTFFFDFAVPIWRAVTRPGVSGFIFSATQDQAIRILGDIKAEVESNPKLQYLYPSRAAGRRWSSTVAEFSNGHTIYARGFGTRVRGAHPFYAIVDDGLNDDDMYSPMVRRKNIDYFFSAISNMIVPGGQLIVVGTPFHQADLYGDLSQNEMYKHAKYQAMSKSGKPLWPDRYDKKRLADKRKEIGSVRFTREFQCEPIADDMSLFPEYLFKGQHIEQMTMTLGMPLEVWEAAGVKSMFMGVDFAMSSSVEADYTVIWVMGMDGNGNRWVVDIVRGRGLPYQAQLSKINEVARKYDVGLIFLESNQAQRVFGDELIRTTDLPIHLHHTGVEKHALDKGVPSLRILLENGKFRIPRGDKRSIEMTNIWIEEMRSFTWAEGKLQSVGTHDDTVMACWICDQACKRGGFSFDFGDDIEPGDDYAMDDYEGMHAPVDPDTDYLHGLEKTIARLEHENKGNGKNGKNGSNGKDLTDGTLGEASGNLIDDDYALPPMIPGVDIAGTWY